MSNKNEILPCPFCGGEGNLGYQISMAGKPTKYAVNCSMCGATFHPVSNEQDAISEWNTRMTVTSTAGMYQAVSIMLSGARLVKSKHNVTNFRNALKALVKHGVVK